MIEYDDGIHLNVLSLGAGVQSSTLALMCEYGEFPVPDAAVFADVGAEPASVYRWLDQLEEMVTKFPIYRVQQGDLYEDSLQVKTSQKSGKRYAKSLVPFFAKKYNGCKAGMFPRKCTGDYKIAPLKRQARKMMKDAGLKRVRQWIGISTDEASRMKDSQIQYVTHHYPLIELGMSRQDCLDWMKAKDLPQPPRSACVFCPYHSDAEWARLARDEPEDFAKAVQWERDVQRAFAEQDEVSESMPFLHGSMVTLDKALFDARHQLDMFTVECEGMCGV